MDPSEIMKSAHSNFYRIEENRWISCRFRVATIFEFVQLRWEKVQEQIFRTGHYIEVAPRIGKLWLYADTQYEHIVIFHTNGLSPTDLPPKPTSYSTKSARSISKDTTTDLTPTEFIENKNMSYKINIPPIVIGICMLFLIGLFSVFLCRRNLQTSETATILYINNNVEADTML